MTKERPETNSGPLPEKEELKRPGLINQLIPYLITIAIFIYLYFTIDFKKMFLILAGANLALFIPAIAAYVIFFGLNDSFTFGQAYSWFNARLKTLEKMEVRIAPYVVQPLFAPLAEVVILIWLWRRKKVPPAHGLSSALWTVANDLAAVFTPLTIIIIYNLKARLIPGVGLSWLLAMIAFWMIYFASLVFWHSPLKPRAVAWIERPRQTAVQGKGATRLVLRSLAAGIQLLSTFSQAKWHHYLYIYLIRLSLFGFSLAANYAALASLGIKVPFELMLMAIPFIFYSYFLPVNVAGYGGPQGISILFFSQIGKVAGREEIAAYSFLYSTGFLAGRFLFGLLFIKSFWKHAFPQGFRTRGKSTQ